MTTSVRFMTSSEVCRILSRTARLEKFFDPGTLLFAHRFRLFRSMSNGTRSSVRNGCTTPMPGPAERDLADALGSGRFKEFQDTLLQISELNGHAAEPNAWSTAVTVRS